MHMLDSEDHLQSECCCSVGFYRAKHQNGAGSTANSGHNAIQSQRKPRGSTEMQQTTSAWPRCHWRGTSADRGGQTHAKPNHLQLWTGSGKWWADDSF